MLKQLLVKPARRHLCEMCFTVFECHLCSIHHMHSAHINHDSNTRFAYVCAKCSRSSGRLFILLVTKEARKHCMKLYNYLTGECVWTRQQATQSGYYKRWYNTCVKRPERSTV